jgi:alpha-D-xyloside xylohydrolase
MKRRATALICALSVMAGCSDEEAQRVERDADGVIVTPKSGPAKQVRLDVLSDRIVRVTAVPTEGFDIPASLMVDPTLTAAATIHIETADGVARVRTAELIA